MKDSSNRSQPRVLAALLALAALHALTSTRFPWQAPQPLGHWLRPNPDGLLLLSLACLCSWLLPRGRALRKVLEHGLVIAFLGVPAFRCLDSLLFAYHGRQLDFFNDVYLVPGLVHLLLGSYSPAVQVLCLALLLLIVAALHFITLRILRCFLAAAEGLRFRLLFVGFTAILAGSGWLLGHMERSLWLEPTLPVIGRRTLEIYDRWHEARIFNGLLERTENQVAQSPKDLGALAGHDIYLFFVESYGRSLFRTPRTAQAFGEWASEWEAELEGDGISVVSGAGYPSVRGGGSALAHAEFLCGVQVPNYRVFERLLESSLDPLPAILGRAGYRGYNVQPAMYEEWPKGAFFGFEEDVFLSALPYEGYPYHWGTMPDQFALAYVLENIVRPGAGPLFLQYVTVTCHAPFQTLPPYYADWDRALEPGAFDRPPVKSYPIHWGNYHAHPELEEAYMGVIRYSLQAILDFTRKLPRPALVILVGDHQPPGLLSLEENDPSHDVPIHVLSKSERLLQPFRDAGFGEGLTPPLEFEAFSTSLFLTHFLGAFSESPSTAQQD